MLNHMVSQVDGVSRPNDASQPDASGNPPPKMSGVGDKESPPKDMTGCREATPKRAPARRQYSSLNRDTPSHWNSGRKAGRGASRGLGRGNSSSSSSSGGASRFGGFESNPFHIPTCPRLPSYGVSVAKYL